MVFRKRVGGSVVSYFLSTVGAAKTHILEGVRFLVASVFGMNGTKALCVSLREQLIPIDYKITKSIAVKVVNLMRGDTQHQKINGV